MDVEASQCLRYTVMAYVVRLIPSVALLTSDYSGSVQKYDFLEFLDRCIDLIQTLAEPHKDRVS